jgi:dienelactone hydrolase
MTDTSCCTKGFAWSGTPRGTTDKIGPCQTYISTGSNPNPTTAILLIHDLFGWEFPNNRLLADHYAAETNATVYLPDFFGGETVSVDAILNERWAEIDLPDFLSRNGRTQREPEIFAVAKALKSKFPRVGAVGFCFGGWAVFRLGAKEHQPPLVDAITAGHPSLLTKEDIDGVGVPVQLLAPEIDAMFPVEMRQYAFQTIITKGVPFDYQHYPGVEHACFVRGDEKKKGEREAMVRGKNDAVAWMRQFLA